MMLKTVYKLKIWLTKIVIFLLLFCPICFGEVKCTDLFEKTAQNDFATSKYSKSSPSGKNPLFRIKHEDFAEKGNDGLNYLHPYNTEWVPGGDIQVNKTYSRKSPEGMVNFQGHFSKKTVYAQADTNIVQPDSNFSVTKIPWGHASFLRLRVSSANPNQVHSLILAEQGKEKARISFRAPSTPTDIKIPLPQKKNWDFVWHAQVYFEWNLSGAKEFDLNIYGPMTFERDPFSADSPARKYIVNNSLIHIGPHAGYREGRFATNAPLMELALKNLANPKNQQYALKIGHQGVRAIRQELALLGFQHEIELNDKLDVNDFFRRSYLSQKNRDYQITLPVETGDFAKEHGSYTHALQLFAMTRGMTKQQIHEFIFGNYNGFFNSPSTQWAAWDMIFDAPGDFGPNSPLWWRLQLEKLGAH